MQITTRAEIVGSLATGAVCGACAVLLLAPARRRALVPPASAREPSASLEGIIDYNQLWVGADGITHMAENLSFGSLEKKGYSGTPQYVRQFSKSDFTVKSVVVTQMVGENPWHYAPSEQFVVTLAGAWYVRTSDGTTRVFKAGDVLYQDNTRQHPAAVDGTQKAMHYRGVAPGYATCSQLVIQVERVRPPTADNAGAWS